MPLTGSFYFDLRASNTTVSHVEIRKMDLPALGFGTIWAYEITDDQDITYRGTLQDEDPTLMTPLKLVLDVLADYLVNHPYREVAEQSSDPTELL